jgi:hypothetical protein
MGHLDGEWGIRGGGGVGIWEEERRGWNGAGLKGEMCDTGQVLKGGIQDLGERTESKLDMLQLRK